MPRDFQGSTPRYLGGLVGIDFALFEFEKTIAPSLCQLVIFNVSRNFTLFFPYQMIVFDFETFSVFDVGLFFYQTHGSDTTYRTVVALSRIVGNPAV